MTQSTPRASAGFTIIELLVAVAITAAMAAMMLAMTTNIMSSWTRASGNLSAQTQARLALDYLQRDLERTIFRQDGNVWFAVDTVGQGEQNLWQSPSDSSRAKPTGAPGNSNADWDPNNIRFGWAGVWMRFFTADPDVNAVSYQIVRRTPVQRTSVQAEIDSRARYMLYRSRVGSESTFANGYDILNQSYNPTGGANPSADGALEFAGADPGANPDLDAAEVRFPSRDTLLANNVVDFGVRLFWRTVDPGDNDRPVYKEIFPNPIPGPNNAQFAHRSPALPGQAPQPESFTSASYGTYDYPGTDPTGATEASTRIPNVAEITLRILTDEGATLLLNYEAGRIEGDWWDIVEAHSRIFTRRVVLRNAPATR